MELASPRSPEIITTGQALERALVALRGANVVAIDLEANGMFAYRARPCVVQLAAHDPSTGAARILLVDALATELSPLGEMLASPNITKIVHDVAFDARILAESGLELASVRDTSLVAHMLGLPATGLGALLASELGVTIDKTMQQHDWGLRPLDADALTYLAGDVVHLEALASKLWALAETRGIVAEVEEETRYRLRNAIASASAVDPRRPYMRIKGVEGRSPHELAILRRLADLREERARSLDVPPYKIIGSEILLAIAARAPRTLTDLENIRGATSGSRARALAPDLLDAVRQGLDDGDVPEDERAAMARPTMPAEALRMRRTREQRLTRWRRSEAKRRGVDEQVVLPGHCLKAIAELALPTLEGLATIPGLGTFRLDRSGQAMLAALTESEATP